MAIPLIGAQVSSLRPFLQTRREVRSAFFKLHQAGYRAVQLQWLSPALSPAFIAGALQEAGLKSVSTQDYFEQVEQDWEATLQLHRLCGSRDVCVSGIPGEDLDLSACANFTVKANEMVSRLNLLGMTLSFHPRAREFARIKGQTAVERVLEQTPGMRLGLDCYHAVKAGEDPAGWIRRYKERVSFVHFKDYLLKDGAQRLVPIGQGCIDWVPIIKACKEAGIPWVFAEQESWEKDPFACMEESLSYLKSAGLQAQ